MVKWNLWQRHLLQNHALVITHISEPFSLYAKGNEVGGSVNVKFCANENAAQPALVSLVVLSR